MLAYNQSSEPIINYTLDRLTASAGNYTLVCNISATENFTSASNEQAFEIAKASPSLSLSASPSWTVTYPTETTITGSETNEGDVDLTYNLYMNGALVTNPYTETLGAGTYEFIYNTSGGENYTAGSVSNTLIVNKGTTVLSLSASPSWNVYYPTEVTLNCYANNDEVTPHMYVNDEEVSIPYTQTFAAGTYDVVCNATETQNYTSATTSNTLTVNKGVTDIDLYLNGVEENISVVVNSNVNMTAVVNVSSLQVCLSLNMTGYGDNFQCGVGSVTNITQFTSIGYYNVTAHTDGNENYTSATATLFINVTENTPPSVAGITIYPSQPRVDQKIYCYATIIDSEHSSLTAFYTWYVNDTAVVTGSSGVANNTYSLISTLEPSYTHVGDVVKCEVKPYDGIDYGTPVNSSSVTVLPQVSEGGGGGGGGGGGRRVSPPQGIGLDTIALIAVIVSVSIVATFLIIRSLK